MKTVGERIVKARDQKGWSRRKLADTAGVPYPTLAGLENGDQQTSSWVPAIAAATGVSALWLASGKGDMRPQVAAVQPSQLTRFDADKVEDTVTALLTVLRRRDPTATLSFEDRIDVETFCEAYALLEELEDERQGREAGAVIADLVAKREERRNAREREQGGAGQQAGGADRGKAGRKAAGA
ncbi:helix-turn-helix domain-containing protein [Lysobacter soli]|uniref:helix-turn-helix domain-containing protein n=1 Tax=Lysobacter soli TaxID=453783 RepID=UPI0037C7D28D